MNKKEFIKELFESQFDFSRKIYDVQVGDIMEVEIVKENVPTRMTGKCIQIKGSGFLKRCVLKIDHVRTLKFGGILDFYVYSKHLTFKKIGRIRTRRAVLSYLKKK